MMSFTRKRLRITLLRTVLESLRGSRGIRRTFMNRAWKIQDTDINMIDTRDSDLIIIIACLMYFLCLIYDYLYLRFYLLY